MEVFIVDVHGKINPVRVEETCETDDFRNRVIPTVLNLGPIRGNLILPSGKSLEGKRTLKEEGVNNKGKLTENFGQFTGYMNIRMYMNDSSML